MEDLNPLICYCEQCEFFFHPAMPKIRGNGATLILSGTGRFKTHCPTCGREASSPGGVMKIRGNVFYRVSCDISLKEAESLDSTITEIQRSGLPEKDIDVIINGFAPDYRTVILKHIGDSNVLLSAVVVPEDKNAEGLLIKAVTIPWFRIINLIKEDPGIVYKIHWAQWEEIIAASYFEAGFEVTLTPRSGDGGKDIIATTSGLGAIRIFDQVKAYAPNHPVPANDVRALMGVISRTPNVSKAILTTTSNFAPGVYQEFKDDMPYRLELRPRERLIDDLVRIASNRSVK